MASLNGFLRALALRGAFGAAAAFSVVAAADAQWFPPLGAAPPGEIVERLQAEGYVLIQPLRRNGTVYLADVRAGSGGHERLVLDAWSGEILQRFVARPRIGRSGSETFFVEGGEFSSPPPLGPPPARDFFAYGGAPDAQTPPGPVGRPEPGPRSKVRRPGAFGHKAPEPTPQYATPPAAQTAKPQDGGGTGNAGSATATGAPPAATEPARPAAQPPSGSPAPSPAMAETQPKAAPPSSRPSAPVPQPAGQRGDKSKVNDIPVNPLE
ncbi:MAG TPA: hypothetical protein VKG91_14095 [Roseiarcus sp.]|nr:hypothetical protein [Roseiarcus sp.]